MRLQTVSRVRRRSDMASELPASPASGRVVPVSIPTEAVQVMQALNFGGSSPPASPPAGPAQPARRCIVLVGGGHAHVQVIKALNLHARPLHTDVVLIDPQREASYSGMVPGCVSGLYTEDETKIKLGPLADWAGMRFINMPVTDIDVEAKTLTMTDYATGREESVCYDVVSLDIGSTTRGFEDVPGAKEHTIPTRPISALTVRIQKAATALLARDLGEERIVVNVVVVGGGAAGIELAFGMKARWGKLFAGSENVSVHVILLNSGEKLYANETEMCQRATNEGLAARGIEVRHNCRVQEVTASQLLLTDGDCIDTEHVIWATGASCHPLSKRLQERGLAVDDRSWITVNSTLESTNCPGVFAAGDCCTIVAEDGRAPPPKAGVYAVRSGPILIKNLTNYLAKEPLITYAPQGDFLRLLMCGDGTAIGFRFGIAFSGKWVWELKDHIDVMFMQLFQSEYLPKEKEDSLNTAQYDAKKMTDVDADDVEASEAAGELMRTDDGVDYMRNWAILRRMMTDNTYKDAVLRYVERPQQQDRSMEVMLQIRSSIFWKIQQEQQQQQQQEEDLNLNLDVILPAVSCAP